jgi:hypothetical protein
VTFIHPGSGDVNAVHISIDDRAAPDWRYPGCYSYDRADIAQAVDLAGVPQLVGIQSRFSGQIPYKHWGSSREKLEKRGHTVYHI